MVYVFRVVSPGNDLDGESWDFQDTTYASASQRAYAKLADTFALASEERRERTHLAFVGEFASKKAAESGVSLMPSDVDTVLAVTLAEDMRAS
jgi:hypothetical protein